MPNVSFFINKFDMMHGVFSVPMDAVWYRAYRVGEQLTTNPLFFGDIQVAWLNAQQPNRRLGVYHCKKSLNLIDMRYLMAILPSLFVNDDLASIKLLSLALGLSTFQKQIELLEELDKTDYPNLSTSIQRMKDFQTLKTKPNWVNPLEMRGVRIGITDIDYKVVEWLKDLFGKVIDGIVAPVLPTPFHDQGSSDIKQSVMYQELIIFNPKESLLYIEDYPIGSKMTFPQLTVPFGEAYLNRAYIRELATGHRMCGGSNLKTPRRKIIFNKDEISEKAKAELKLERKAWLPYIRRMQKSHQFLQHTFITFKALVPVQPTGTIIER